MASHFNKQIHLSKGLKLLSLDGGGVKGISSLVILDAIMNKLRDHHKLKDTPRHYDCFDLAGGTSTGGLIALLLFRLQMTTSDAIDKFREIAKNLFSPRVFGMNLHDDFGTLGLWLGNAYVHWATLIGSSRFSAEPLQRAIDDVLKEKSPHEEDKSLGGESSLLRDEEYGAGKMYVPEPSFCPQRWSIQWLTAPGSCVVPGSIEGNPSFFDLTQPQRMPVLLSLRISISVLLPAQHRRHQPFCLQSASLTSTFGMVVCSTITPSTKYGAHDTTWGPLPDPSNRLPMTLRKSQWYRQW